MLGSLVRSDLSVRRTVVLSSFLCVFVRRLGFRGLALPDVCTVLPVLTRSGRLTASPAETLVEDATFLFANA